jgi:hypothetical protein
MTVSGWVRTLLHRLGIRKRNLTRQSGQRAGATRLSWVPALKQVAISGCTYRQFDKSGRRDATRSSWLNISAKKDHLIACKNFRASPNNA